MDKTIFEKILDKEIPSYKIYEDEHVYAFLDVFPITKGHTLVIPKKHSRNILDCEAETAAHIGAALPKIANAVKDAFNPDGINIIQNNEEYAGQSVFHLHFHIIPRYKDKHINFDNLEVKWPPQKLEAADFEEIQNKITSKL
ncbi:MULTISPECIES: HIT family protein [unclassified Gemella]|uniref:HIT family protein n=1 Tax=unclassified Gemella TaxID=2624949 RepID=UPI0010749D41|nr:MULTISPECIES: HIT family protein [unclassified Gemella]MBF0710737.1 HIT family protein [Gemella sp. GL1.1]MBF0746694.1 HIT family protein [Gemella sp. 19428wG2_WT2a]NYS28081.1 HIT family protein [Gemella sp. GL1]TFU60043.1 HIT family protein [Gemella sp. WT2a]